VAIAAYRLGESIGRGNVETRRRSPIAVAAIVAITTVVTIVSLAVILQSGDLRIMVVDLGRRVERLEGQLARRGGDWEM
jgi:hypothetical protein